MLIWLDLLTPKQVNFLGELGRKLEAGGHSVFRTTRKYREANELIKLKNLNVLSVGKYGGASLEGKLGASSDRIKKLSRIISRLKPDISIAFASPEAARTAFGLAIPHYTINDSPHSKFVARLTIPLSTKLFTPSIIPNKIWTRYGAKPKMIIKYNALDPIAWLRNFIPNPSVLSDLELDISIPIIVFRVEEAFASYLLNYTSAKESVTIPVIREIINNYQKPLQIVALPRYLEQIPLFMSVFHNNIRIPRKIVDGPSLVFFASIFVGAGGTMTAESALLGTPTISCFPRKPTIVEKYLIQKKLVSRETKPKKIAEKIFQILDDLENTRNKQRRKARNVTSTMEDPTEIIIKEIEEA